MANGIEKWQNRHMNVKIDSAGRIVVPKSVRDRLGLAKDSELALEERGDGIFLTPIQQHSALVRDKRGWWVHTGKPIGNIDWDRIVEDEREERMRKIGGW
jgi:AbrB family looped-hinge helix DNA binding protein